MQQRFRFRVGTWPLDTRRGTDSVIGHSLTPRLAATVLTAAAREEGGAEVLDVTTEVRYRRDTRELEYTARVESIYGAMTLTGTVL